MIEREKRETCFQTNAMSVGNFEFKLDKDKSLRLQNVDTQTDNIFLLPTAGSWCNGTFFVGSQMKLNTAFLCCLYCAFYMSTLNRMPCQFVIFLRRPKNSYKHAVIATIIEIRCQRSHLMVCCAVYRLTLYREISSCHFLYIDRDTLSYSI